MKLTEKQRSRLCDIGKFQPGRDFPYPAYWKDSPTDRSLVRRGLIERVEYEKPLGGTGAMSGIKAIWDLCKITPAGRRALDEVQG